jgi:serine protease Do
MDEKTTTLKEENVNTSHEKTPKKASFSFFSFFSHAFVSLLSGIVGGIIVIVLFSEGNLSSMQGLSLSSSSGENSPFSSDEVHRTLIAEDEAVTGVVDRVSPSVVSIVITKDVAQMNRFFRSPFDFFFDPFGDSSQGYGDDSGSSTKQRIGGGTGFFVTKDGMIVTNKHVVNDSSAQYTVVTQDGTEYEAKVLALDPIRDIAIIQVEGENFPVVELGDSDALRTGQTVLAIGYSLGEFSNSVSKGIVSGMGRSILAGSSYGETERLTDIIQTDAAINPGNSGGPLLDTSGRVIGVNVAVAQDAENVGFALPIQPVQNIIDQVRETGKITVPFLGIRYVMVDEEVASANNLPNDYGALILRGENRSDLSVVPGSPADKAGLEEYDIILEMNGEKVTDEMPLDAIIAQYDVGDTLVLKVWSEGEEEEISVTLGSRE